MLHNCGTPKPVSLPIITEGNRIPTLHITKTNVEPNNPEGLNIITIDGAQKGDIIINPLCSDGEIQVYEGDRSLRGFFIFSDTKDSQGQNMSIMLATAGLEPIIDLSNITYDQQGRGRKKIKKNEQIGRLLTSDRIPIINGQIRISGAQSTT